MGIGRALPDYYGCAFKFLFVYETYLGRVGLYEKMWEANAGQSERTEQQCAELKQSEMAGIDVAQNVTHEAHCPVLMMIYKGYP